MVDRQDEQEGRQATPCATPTEERLDYYHLVLAELSDPEDAEALELIEHAGGLPTH